MRRARFTPLLLIPLAAVAVAQMRGNGASAEVARAQPAPPTAVTEPEPVEQAAEPETEDSWTKLIALGNPATPKDKIIRVGLSTAAGGPVQFYSTGQMGLTDPTQPGRRLITPGGRIVQILFGDEEDIKAGTKTYTGPITVKCGDSEWKAWGALALYVTAPPARMTSNGANPKWGRPYRGHFEVWPQRLPEPGHREGNLTVTNVVPLEEYLKGVVPWEMSPSAPLEALKAQAICARTKTLSLVNSKKFAAGGFDVCDYDACQGYPGTENEKPRTTLAVEQTRGFVVTYKDRLIDAVYGTNSGGITAAASDVWKSTSPTPYLQSVRDLPWKSEWSTRKKPIMTEADWAAFFSDPWPSFAKPSEGARRDLAARRAKSAFASKLFGPEDWPEFYRWKREISLEQADEAFADRGFTAVTGFEVLKRTDSGRIRQLRVAGTTTRNAQENAPAELVLDGDGAIRSMLSKRLGSTTALPSSAFAITPQADAAGQLTGWTLQGAGWGHGVGLCQRGAQNHADDGWDARKILKWYYRNVEIKQAP